MADDTVADDFIDARRPGGVGGGRRRVQKMWGGHRARAYVPGLEVESRLGFVGAALLTREGGRGIGS